LDFQGLAGLLAAVDVELPLEAVELDALLAILTIFTGSFSSSISLTLTLFLDWVSLWARRSSKAFENGSKSSSSFYKTCSILPLGLVVLATEMLRCNLLPAIL